MEGTLQEESDQSYETEPSSEEESKDDAQVEGALPAPYLGRPYPVKTFVNTMNKDALKEICREILKMKGDCITLESNGLQRVLFSQNLAFSKIAGK